MCRETLGVHCGDLKTNSVATATGYPTTRPRPFYCAASPRATASLSPSTSSSRSRKRPFSPSTVPPLAHAVRDKGPTDMAV